MRIRRESIRFMGEVRSTETTIELKFENNVLVEAKIEVLEEYEMVRTIYFECRKARFEWVSEIAERCFDMVLDLTERVLPEFRTLRIHYKKEMRREI
jgi:hypothetical protein